MKKISIALSVIALLMVGCNDKPKEDTTEVQKDQTTKSSAATNEPENIYGAATNSMPPHGDTPPAGADVQASTPHVAIILETMNATGYTYAKVDEDGAIYWIASPQTNVKVGDTVSYIEQMVMKDFVSKSLDKTFDYLMFASAMVKPGEAHDHASHVSQPHPVDTKSSSTPNTVEATVEKISVAKLDGGYNIEELYASKDKLKDKSIKLRAKVVKVSKAIMGKDWIHLQDGTGEGATSDIMLTTKDSTVKVGDIVIVEAIYKTDVDLGYGYFFEVILQEGKFVN
ncbi:MAG: hypothetical protein L3I99_06590 [Sulfurimonas sp.]|nr:hypothetical protein [Sulfurimonas sp.]